MPKLKVLSGLEVVKILEQFGFSVASQKGSHVKLKRQLERPVHFRFAHPQGELSRVIK